MNLLDSISSLVEFREQVYASFRYRRDSLMDLLDALCANTGVSSVVELSLHGLFRRGYSALYAAIEALGLVESPAQSQQELEPPQKSADENEGTAKIEQTCPQQVRDSPETETPEPPQGTDATAEASLSEYAPATGTEFPRVWSKAIAKLVPAPKKRNHWVFGVDVTPVERPHARTLKDREFVYKPTDIRGNKPVTLGHNYSLIASLPEEESPHSRWIVPLSVERVDSFESKCQVGQEQLDKILNDEDPSLPWQGDLCVAVMDSDYGHQKFLHPWGARQKRLLLTRVRSNRVFYHKPRSTTPKKRGAPRRYGERFDLKDETTWGTPTQTQQLSFTTTRGKKRQVTLERWSDLLMRGSREHSMHQYPFDLVRVQLEDLSGHRVFKPQWLILFGVDRHQLDLIDIYHDYRQRFNLEHGFRFCKQRLLMNTAQTPDVIHEERWVHLCWLAYAQLWATRHQAESSPLPWQRYLPSAQHPSHCSASRVQRDFERIIRQIGTPAKDSKPRGKSPGRVRGAILTPRPARPVIKRRYSRRKKRKKAD